MKEMMNTEYRSNRKTRGQCKSGNDHSKTNFIIRYSVFDIKINDER